LTNFANSFKLDVRFIEKLSIWQVCPESIAIDVIHLPKSINQERGCFTLSCPEYALLDVLSNLFHTFPGLGRHMENKLKKLDKNTNTE
jgi:hypothetical protein